MNLFLLADIDYPLMARYVNSLYDPDAWVLSSDMLGTHLNDHFYHLNGNEDPDPTLTQIIFPDETLYHSFVPVMKDHTAAVLDIDEGVSCSCPMIMLVHRAHYDHFYRR